MDSEVSFPRFGGSHMDLGGATLAPQRARRDELMRPPASRQPFSIARAPAKDATSAADGGELSLLDPSALSWAEQEADDAASRLRDLERRVAALERQLRESATSRKRRHESDEDDDAADEESAGRKRACAGTSPDDELASNDPSRLRRILAAASSLWWRR